MNKKGFTLIELMIVVVILGIVASIAIGKFIDLKDRARQATLVSDLRNVMTAQESYFESAGAYADDRSLLVLNVSPVTNIDLWDRSDPYTFRARAHLVGRPDILCGVFIGSTADGPPDVPGIGPVVEGVITCP